MDNSAWTRPRHERVNSTGESCFTAISRAASAMVGATPELCSCAEQLAVGERGGAPAATQCLDESDARRQAAAENSERSSFVVQLRGLQHAREVAG